MEKYYMSIFDKETNQLSNKVPLEDIIYDQNMVEFDFPDETSLPYNDFLFYRKDYEVLIERKIEDE